MICRLLEAWLTKKLVEPTISDSIPVLEDNIQSSVLSIERHLKADTKVWAGISQAFIQIRCGHVFMLNTCCDDETIVHLGAEKFYQDVRTRARTLTVVPPFETERNLQG